MSKKQKVQKRLTDKSKPKLINLLTWRGSMTKKLANLRFMILEAIVISKLSSMKFQKSLNLYFRAHLQKVMLLKTIITSSTDGSQET